MDFLTDLTEAILCGDSQQAEEVARSALAANTQPQELLTAGVATAVQELCRRFEAQQSFLPELLVACRAIRKALAVIRPLAAVDGYASLSQVLVISLSLTGDLAARLAADLLEGAGFAVTRTSLGATAEESAETHRAAKVPIVVLVVPTMTCFRQRVPWQPMVHATLEKLRNARGRNDAAIVLLGGAFLSVDESSCDVHVHDIAHLVAAVEQLGRHTVFEY
jgi:5-methyltetrahydrofolate--homocysteine methyltransferase